MMSALPELVTAWSVHWTRLPKLQSSTTLPSITFLDKHLSFPPPPPQDVSPPHYSSPPTRLAPMHHPEPEKAAPLFTDTKVDWLDFTRSAHFIAEKTCEMICYLWFTTPHTDEPDNSSLFSRPNSASTLQLVASPTFVSFMQKLLETTQVSQSVIVLSLHYIYRLKERNRTTPAQAGSEFRIAVAGLMMANKFLDDNTYTNKTWSEVSGIELSEINRMEREFLMGVDCNLYVDKPTYRNWLNLLKGLVLAKERDSRRYHKSRTTARPSRPPGSILTNTPQRYVSRGRPALLHHRARSTSPEHSHRYNPSVSPQYVSHIPSAAHADSSSSPTFLRSGAKRSAGAAFSPTSATFSHIPSKRPVSISLHIPESSFVGSHHSAGSNSNSNSSSSPLEGLQSFARMSIDSPNPHPHPPGPAVLPPRSSHATNGTGTGTSPPSWSYQSKKEVVPETLTTAYALDEKRRGAVPENLYFYSLACSPTDDEENRSRKARLRYHKPPPPSSSLPYYQPRPPTYPMNVQSASTSPVHVTAPLTLPHFHDVDWTRQPVNRLGFGHGYRASPSSSSAVHNTYAYTQPPPPPPTTSSMSLGVPSVEPPRYQAYPQTQTQAHQQGYHHHPHHHQPQQAHQSSTRAYGAVGSDYDREQDADVDIKIEYDDEQDPEYDEYEYDEYSNEDEESGSPMIESAPFANAGPPGLQFGFCPTPTRRLSPVPFYARSRVWA
jgi:hypothetical protein